MHRLGKAGPSLPQTGTEAGRCGPLGLECEGSSSILERRLGKHAPSSHFISCNPQEEDEERNGQEEESQCLFLVSWGHVLWVWGPRLRSLCLHDAQAGLGSVGSARCRDRMAVRAAEACPRLSAKAGDGARSPCLSASGVSASLCAPDPGPARNGLPPRT